MTFHSTDQTITAIATAPGDGAISIIRLSGKDALDIANKIFSKDVKSFLSHTAHYGKISDYLTKQTLDHVLLLTFHAPKSFTGENVVEIHCHGGSFITKKILQSSISAGAVAALPGEFSFRAFMNEKFDLSQAEAIQNLISAKGDAALHAAKNQLEGLFSKKIQKIQKEFIYLLAELEAWMDFSEEDLEREHFYKLQMQLDTHIQFLEKISNTFQQGRKLQEGYSVAIIGAPNVGKSSILNCLLEKNRAIVSSQAGTTRDTLEEQWHSNGFIFHLIDTAGIRTTEQEVELEGIKRAQHAIQSADFILWVVDSSRELNKEEKEIFVQLDPKNTLIVCNKMDIAEKPPTFKKFNTSYVCAKNHEGIDPLKENIYALLEEHSPLSKEEIVLTQMRHKQAMDLAIINAKKALEGLQSHLSSEFIAFDIREALHHLSTIIGLNVTEEVLSRIFSKFCIGK